jgi:hypothetical protein
MSEKQKPEPHGNIEHTYHASPTKTVSRSNNFGTLASDHAIITLDGDTGLGTITFFQTHTIPKMEDKGIMVDSVEEEVVLEVKMPFNTVFALGIYIANMVSHYQNNPNDHGKYFGPVAVKNIPKQPSEAKKT